MLHHVVTWGTWGDPPPTGPISDSAGAEAFLVPRFRAFLCGPIVVGGLEGGVLICTSLLFFTWALFASQVAYTFPICVCLDDIGRGAHVMPSIFKNEH